MTNEDLAGIPAGGLTISLKNYGLTFVQSDKTANMPTTTKWMNGCTEFTKKDTYEVGDVISFCNKNKGYTNSKGSYVKGKREDFYVISDNGDTVTALASYNLMVGSEATDKYATAFPGLQAKDTTRYPVAFATKDGNNKSGSTYLGYWTDATNYALDKPLEAYGTSYPADVYDKNSILYEYVQKYQTYFTNTLNKTTAKMRLITHNELIGLGCEKTNSYSGSCETETVTANKREWIYNAYYWTASAYGSNGLWVVFAGGDFDDRGFWYDAFPGVRPVITISKSDI